MRIVPLRSERPTCAGCLQVDPQPARSSHTTPASALARKRFRHAEMHRARASTSRPNLIEPSPLSSAGSLHAELGSTSRNSTVSRVRRNAMPTCVWTRPR